MTCYFQNWSHASRATINKAREKGSIVPSKNAKEKEKERNTGNWKAFWVIYTQTQEKKRQLQSFLH